MAAKTIEISTDDITYVALPGSGGEFSGEAEGINDTILGETFNSQEVGLTQWGVSSDGIFKGFAGYLAEIKVEGTPVPVTGESFTQEAGQIYAIDDATREIWDRDATITVFDNAIDRTADVDTFDYLFGRVTFRTGYTVVEPVTADLSYMPVAAFAKANTYNLTMTAESIDETDFATAQGNSGTRIFKPGLRSVSLELGGIFDATGAFAADVLTRLEYIIEIDPAGDGSSIARGIFKLMNEGQSGDVGALEEETLTYELQVPIDTQVVETPFNWRHTSSTLNVGIQNVLTSWLTELNTYFVRYLPQGAVGQTPLDGKKGTFIVTDISLSGGLSAMNVFTIELVGTGAYTVV